MTVTVILLIGLPGAGKTRMCFELSNILLERMKVHHINYDKEINEEVFSEHEETSWKDARSDIITSVTDLIRTIKDETHETSKEQLTGCRNHVILLDDNFYYQSMRHPFYIIAKEYECGFGYLVLDTPRDFCLRNDSQRERPVGPDVINRMASKIEWPDRRTSWDSFCHVITDVTRVNWEAVTNFIADRQACPLSRVEELAAVAVAVQSRIECQKNVAHQADIILRRLIKEHISLAGSPTPTSWTRKLADCKKLMLQAIRAGQIPLPDDLDLSCDSGVSQLNLILSRSFSERLKS